MRLVLIRHAHAVSMEEHVQRPLSTRGRDDTRRMTDFFKANRQLTNYPFVWHSFLARSRETANLMLPAFSTDTNLVETPGLLPDDIVHPIAERLDHLGQDVIIVGHEPHLSALGTLLIRGKEAPAAFDFPKSSVLALEMTGKIHKKNGLQRWRTRWFMTLDLLAS